MKSYVINDLHFVLVISRIGGIINYLTPKEICFYITDYNFEMKCTAIEQKQARAMIALGLLKIVSLSAEQVTESFRLFNIYKPKFIPETISSIIAAKSMNLTMVSDDTPTSTAEALAKEVIDKNPSDAFLRGFLFYSNLKLVSTLFAIPLIIILVINKPIVLN